MFYKKEMIINILDFIELDIDSTLPINTHYISLLFKQIYKNLLDNKIINDVDIKVLNEWLKYLY